MTHLRIENQNSNVEIVSASIILKLYNLSTEIEENLQEDELLSDYVSLKGNLLTDRCRLAAYDYLIGNLPDSNVKRFANLNINVTGGLYLDFQDPEVERILLANNVGDDVGITLSDLSNVTDIGTWFLNNTDIVSFNELEYTNVHTIKANAFKGCTSLTSIDISNVTSIANYPGEAFSGCTGLTTVIGLSNFDAKNLGHCTFLNCTNLGINLDLILNTTASGTFPSETFKNTGYRSITVNAPNITTFYSRSVDVFFYGMKNVVKADFSNTGITEMNSLLSLTSINTAIYPNTLTNMNWEALSVPSSLLYLVILATTPPTLKNIEYAYLRNANVYVPDASLSLYQSAQYWSDNKVVSHLKPLSELPSSVTWITQTT